MTSFFPHCHLIRGFPVEKAFLGLKSPGHLPFRRLPSLAATVPVGSVTELPPGMRVFPCAPSPLQSLSTCTSPFHTKRPLPCHVVLAGERKVVDTEAGAVIVTNVGGSLYAVLAKCPHLGLPMKTGMIVGSHSKEVGAWTC